jgi:hypothetical protein
MHPRIRHRKGKIPYPDQIHTQRISLSTISQYFLFTHGHARKRKYPIFKFPFSRFKYRFPSLPQHLSHFACQAVRREGFLNECNSLSSTMRMFINASILFPRFRFTPGEIHALLRKLSSFKFLFSCFQRLPYLNRQPFQGKGLLKKGDSFFNILKLSVSLVNYNI